MTTTDSMILILFIAVFLFYCYKKKKFPFSKLRKGDESKQNEPTPNTASAPNIYPFPQMFGQGAQYPFVAYTPTPPRPSCCKALSVPTDAIGSDTDIEYIIDTELEKLAVMNCTVQSVGVLQCTRGTEESTERPRILLIITYTR